MNQMHTDIEDTLEPLAKPSIAVISTEMKSKFSQSPCII